MRLLLVVVVLIALLAGAEASVKTKKQQTQQQQQQQDTNKKGDGKKVDCTDEAYITLAETVAKLKLDGITFVRVENDSEGKRECKLIVSVGVFKGWNKDTKLEKISSDLMATKESIKSGLDKAGIGSAIDDIEIIQTEKLDEDIASGDALTALLESDAVRSSAKRLGRAGLLASGRASAAAAPSKAEPGQWTTGCQHSMAAGDAGTLGGFLMGNNGKALALSNQHVYGTPTCTGKTIAGVSALTGVIPPIANGDHYVFTDPDGAADRKLFKNLAGDTSMDFSTMLVKKGKLLDCKINGKWIQGVRAGSTMKAFAKEAKKRFKVWKLGASTLLTQGEVFSFEPHVANGAFGWWIRGKGPDMPNRVDFHDPQHALMRCPQCYRPNGNGHKVTTPDEAKTADQTKGVGQPWDTRVWNLPGDSGSFILDTEDKVACLHRRGTWEKRNGLWVKTGQCIPFQAVLDKIDQYIGGAYAPVHVCGKKDIKNHQAP